MAVLTQQLVGQHVELLLAQASLGDRRELPAQNLGEFRPLGRRRRQEELQVLERETDQKEHSSTTDEAFGLSGMKFQDEG